MRVLVGVHRRPRARAARRQARAGDDRAPARGGALAAALLARPRRTCRRCRSRRAARAPAGRAEGRTRSTRCSRARPAATARSRSATARSSSSSTRPACAAPRPSGSTSPTSTSSRSTSTSGNGKGAKDRVVPLGEEAALLGRALPARGAAGARARRRGRAVPLGARPPARHLDAAPPRPPTRIGCGTRSRRTCSRAAPTCA